MESMDDYGLHMYMYWTCEVGQWLNSNSFSLFLRPGLEAEINWSRGHHASLHDWSYLCIIFITKLSLTCGGYSSCRCLSSTRFCAFILCWRKLSALFNIIMKTRSWRGTLVQHVKNNLCCILFCLFFSWLWTIAFINFVVEDNSGDETFAILYFLSVIGRDGKPKLLAEFIKSALKGGGYRRCWIKFDPLSRWIMNHTVVYSRSLDHCKSDRVSYC